MSTHNICFCGEIRKMFTGYPLLSRPMSRVLILLEAEFSSCLYDALLNDLSLSPFHHHSIRPWWLSWMRV